MKAGIFYDVRDIRYEDIADPKLLPGDAFDVLVRVKATGVCGSDVHHFLGLEPEPLKAGTVMGHELCGEVVEIGPSVTNVKVGDRVAIEPLIGCGTCPYCRQGDYYLCKQLRHIGYYYKGGFAEYVKAPHEKLSIIPENMEYEEAALLDCYAVAVHALKRVPVNVGDTVLVYGAGPLGICTAQAAMAAGAAHVVIADVLEGALDVARQAGISEAHNSAKEDILQIVLDLTKGAGADVAFDCAGGNAPTIDCCTAALRPNGVLGLIGVRNQISMEAHNSHFKELNIKFIFSYGMWDYKTEFEIAMGMIASKRINAKPLITHRFPLSQIREAFDAAVNKKESQAVKVVIVQ